MNDSMIFEELARLTRRAGMGRKDLKPDTSRTANR
jgi:hypothetical protein